MDTRWRTTRHAALAGCGFALSFGWLWFAGLRGLWMPEHVAGLAPPAVAVFGGALCCGCIAFGLLGCRLAAHNPACVAGTAHGAALFFFAAAWFFRDWPWVFAVFLGMSGAGVGVFWTAAVLRSGPRHVFKTLIWAAGTALVLTPLVVSLSGRIPVPALWLLAWLGPVAAWALSFLMRSNAEEANGGMSPAAVWGGSPHVRFLGWGIVFFSLGMASESASHTQPLSSWAEGVAHLAGAAVAYAAWRIVAPRIPQPSRSLAAVMFLCACAIVPLAALLFFSPALSAALSVNSGLLEALAIAGVSLSFGRSARTGRECWFLRAGVILAMVLAAVNGGNMAGQSLLSAGAHGSLALALVLLLFTIVLTLAGMKEWGAAVQTPGNSAHAEDTAGAKDYVHEACPQQAPLQAEYETLLTEKEQAIAILMGRGYTNNSIANTIGIKENTLRWYIKKIYKKTGTRNRVGLSELIK